MLREFSQNPNHGDIMDDKTRLIEHAFPLKQASLDSVHEKNVRHGHISTLHIWPARRPLAACRAALIATLLPDPGTPEKRKALCEKIAGKVIKKVERKKQPNGEIVEREKEITEGGILHWGRETENKETLEWFRKEIQKAYGGKAPKVLDPFAGGGAIPLEAMRLGCEATAVDINPVAWFILKCTLEYPQKLAGKTHPLPDFILKNEEFMESFYKAHPHLVGKTKTTKKQREEDEERLKGFEAYKRDKNDMPEAGLAWHVRAWGQWVLDNARKELGRFYPTYAEWEPINKNDHKSYEKQPLKLIPLKKDGTPDIDSLNAEFSEEYLADSRNPRWVAKPTVAYLWARTVKCKNCRATIPLLKTRWLCKKDKKRVLLKMEPNKDKTGVVFGVETNVPVQGGNAAQRREHDKNIGAGTMSRSGAKCPCCNAIMTMVDIRQEGRSGRIGSVNTAVVVDGQRGKEYRLPTEHEVKCAEITESKLKSVFSDIPFGIPDEPITQDAKGSTWCIEYGLTQWSNVFTSRQLLSLGTLAKNIQIARITMQKYDYSTEYIQGLIPYLCCIFNRQADYLSTVTIWLQSLEAVAHTFTRFALPISWDFVETNPLSGLTGDLSGASEWVAKVIERLLLSAEKKPMPNVINSSSKESNYLSTFDAIITDPPYYDAIPYSNLMDFFYVWLKRSLQGLSAELDFAFKEPLSPKWDNEKNDGEIVDDASRHGGDRVKSKSAYEDGMARVFQGCNNVLKPEGRMVVVFANKQANAWETLVSALIRTAFVVDGSWPIQTERETRMRALSASALASSVWLVCKKRPENARPGWDNQVLEEMKKNIREKLREFWDAGIRGPDFVWAATGPALEAYSKHPVVRKANEPGNMTVGEFLIHVRRMVVDFVVGRVLSGNGFTIGGEEMDTVGSDRLDEPTAYYLLHRHDFGFEEAPAGACILYAISCGISDKDLAGTWDIIGFTKGKSSDEADEANEDVDEVPDDNAEGQSGGKVKLRTWLQRKGKYMGYEAPGGRPVPLIDRVHRLMHLWKEGNLSKVDEYIDGNGLRRQELFKRLLQSLIEISPNGSEERSLLESLSNHIQARGITLDSPVLPGTSDKKEE